MNKLNLIIALAIVLMSSCNFTKDVGNGYFSQESKERRAKVKIDKLLHKYPDFKFTFVDSIQVTLRDTLIDTTVFTETISIFETDLQKFPHEFDGFREIEFEDSTVNVIISQSKDSIKTIVRVKEVTKIKEIPIYIDRIVEVQGDCPAYPIEKINQLKESKSTLMRWGLFLIIVLILTIGWLVRELRL